MFASPSLGQTPPDAPAEPAPQRVEPPATADEAPADPAPAAPEVAPPPPARVVPVEPPVVEPPVVEQMQGPSPPPPIPVPDPELANPLRPPTEEAILSARPVDPADVTFRPGKGLVVKSEDGHFSLALRWRAQILFTIEHENAPGGETTQGIQIRRARLSTAGNFFGPDNKYKAELAVSPRDVAQNDTGVGTSPLLDAYFDFEHLRDLSLRVGQYKVPFNRQRVVSSGDLQLVDRAITNAEFNIDRDIGFDLRSEDLFGLNLLRYYAGLYPGEGRNAFEQSDFGLMALGRVEVLPFGLFEDYIEGDFERTGPRLSIGAAYAFLDRAKRDRGILGNVPEDAGTTDFHLFNADVAFKAYGLSALSEFFWRTGERNPGPLVDEAGAPILGEDGEPIEVAPARDGYGLMLQAGYFIPRLPLEVVGRYALVRGSDEPGSDGLTDQDEIGGGLNYYFAEHSFKLQGDYMRLAEEGDFGSGTDQIRIQLQAAL